MKRFMYFSIVMLCLSALILIGLNNESVSAADSRPGDAPSSPATGIIGVDALGDATWLLDEFGHVWLLFNNCWERHAEADPPVSVNDIKFWKICTVVTYENCAWVLRNGTWNECGAWPGGSVPAASNTWGGVKGRYDGNK